MTKEENDVKLHIFSDNIEPEEITRQLGLNPSESFKKDDIKLVGPVGKEARVLIRQHTWTLRSAASPKDSIDIHLQNIFEQLTSSVEAIKGLVDADICKAELSIGQKYYGINPGFHFTFDQLSQLLSLGAELDLDVYTFSEE